MIHQYRITDFSDEKMHGRIEYAIGYSVLESAQTGETPGIVRFLELCYGFEQSAYNTNLRMQQHSLCSECYLEPSRF